MKHDYDVIVLGLGVMGSAAVDRLSRSGKRVLGIERFTPAHDRGSSHGETRVIRKVYWEHEDYVPLLHRAYDLWEDLETYANSPLFMKTQCLSIGSENNEVISGCRRSALKHGLACESLDSATIRSRFGMNVGTQVGVLEPDGGILFAEKCVEAFQSRARAHGAELRFECKALAWRSTPEGVEVDLEGETVRAAKLVLSLGSWTPTFLDKSLPLAPKRLVLFWFESSGRTKLPVYVREIDGGPAFYGFPELDGLVKVAFHTVYTGSDPDAPNRTVAPREVGEIRKYAEALLGPLGKMRKAKTCFYTMTPDTQFILGPLPGAEENVVIASGFSGHGFKFASVVGEIVGDLIEGRKRHNIGLFDPARYALPETQL